MQDEKESIHIQNNFPNIMMLGNVNSIYTVDDYKKNKRFNFRSKIFMMFTLLAYNNPIKKTLYIILLACEFGQFIAFLFFYIILFQTSISYSQKDTTQNSLNVGAMINYINLRQILDYYADPIISYVIQSFILLIITVHIIILGIICSKGKDGSDILYIKPTMKFIIQIGAIGQVVLIKILLIPILVVLFSVVICQRQYDETLKNYTYINAYYGYQCWGSSHLVLSVICLSYSMIIIILGAITSFIFNDPKANTLLPWGNQVSSAEFIKMMIKVLISVSLQVDFYSKWIFLILQIANCLLAYLLLHYRVKYFFHSNRKIMVATIVQESSYFCLSVILTVLNSLLKTISYYTFAYIIITTAIFDLLMVIIVLRKDYNYNFHKFPNIENETEFESFFLRFQRYLSNVDHKTIDKVFMFGIIKSHQARCQNPECVCEQLFYLLSHNNLEKHLNQTTDLVMLQEKYFSGSNRYGPKHNILQLKRFKNDTDAKQYKIFDSKFRKIVFKFFNMKLNKAIKKFPNSLRLKYIQLNILQKELNNEFKSYFMIIKQQKEKPLLQWQYLLYVAKQNVEEIMYKKYQALLNNKQGIDVMRVYDFEQLYIQFEKQIVFTAGNCLNFWKELMDKRLDVNRIHDFGVQISNSYTEVIEIANKMIKMYPSHIRFLKLYASFLSDVMNNENESYEIRAKVKSFEQNQNNLRNFNQEEDKFFGYNNKTVIITMTVTPKDIGNIVNANFETRSLLGYQHNELKGKNVRILMPKILSDNHDDFIQNYFETAKAKILEKHRIVIAKDKEGFIMPIYILVKAIPNLKRNLTFVGFLRKLDEHNEFIQPPSQFGGQDYHIILSDHEGYIHGFTQNCWETFGFKPGFFFNQFGDPEQQIRIEKIIKGLKDPHFVNKLELKKDGAFCSLDTGLVMENVSKELLNRDEQEILLNISGSYNINLQIDQMSFANGKIVLIVYKILKVSRIIRSQNVLDMIQMKVDEFNDQSEDASNEFQFADSPHTQSFNHLPKRDSIEIEDDVISKNLNSDDGSDLSKQSSIDIPEDYQKTKYLMNFKKQISTREMPASIIKLNRLVILFASLILLVSILDIIQSICFYQFTYDHQLTLQQLHNKDILIGRISSNLLQLGLVKLGIQSNKYGNFTNRTQLMEQQLTLDINNLELIEQRLQSLSYSSLDIFVFDQYEVNPKVILKSLNEDGSITADEQTLRYAISQIVSKTLYMISQVYIGQSYVLTPEIYKLYPNMTKEKQQKRSESQKSIYYAIQNSVDELITTNEEQISSFIENYNQTIEINKKILIAGIVFFTVFVLLSGIIVFPIVIGVQKNKVMILSIYFELPFTEIERVFFKCYKFLVKLEASQQESQELKQELEYLRQRENDAPIIPKGDISLKGLDDGDVESSRESNRELLELSQIQLGQKYHQHAPQSYHGVPHRIQKYEDEIKVIRNSRFSRRFSLSPLNFNQRGKTNIDNLSFPNTAEQKQESVIEQKTTTKLRSDHSSTQNLKEQISAQPQEKTLNQSDNKNQRQTDSSQLFKDIKVKNNKINIVTLLVIVVLLSYFLSSFLINLSYIKQIKDGTEISNALQSEKPSLEYMNMFFLLDIMKNQTHHTTTSSTSQFMIYMNKVYGLEEQKEKLKKGGSSLISGSVIDYLKTIDNQTYCEKISQQINSDFVKQQCPYIGKGIFKLGEKNSIFTILYEMQQLRVRFESSNSSVAQLRSYLNEDILLKYSTMSNFYYSTSFLQQQNSIQEAILQYFEKIMLFVKLRFSLFAIFLFFIFTGLWRIFLKNIQGEVIRSKGMLNMIPTEFLERDNNLKKLSLNKLINLN